MFEKFQIPRPLDLLGLACGLVALVLHVFGTAAPVWWVVHEYDVQHVEWTFTYGIWVIQDCRNYTCETTSSKMHGDRAWLIGPAVLLVMSAILLLLDTALSLSHLRRNNHEVAFRKLGVILSGGAGGIIILAILIFYKKKAGLRPSAAPETTDGDPGWALFLSTFGGIVAVVNAVIHGVTVGRYSQKSLDKRKMVFGMHANELELDVNALRKGELRQGKRVSITSLYNDVSSYRGTIDMLNRTSKVSTLPLPANGDVIRVNGDISSK